MAKLKRQFRSDANNPRSKARRARLGKMKDDAHRAIHRSKVKNRNRAKNRVAAKSRRMNRKRK